MFKVGDEVVCVNAEQCPELSKGHTYVVERVLDSFDTFSDYEGNSVLNTFGLAIWVCGGFDFRDPESGESGYSPNRFRKVQRRDIGEWLKTSVGNTSKWDKTRKVSA